MTRYVLSSQAAHHNNLLGTLMLYFTSQKAVSVLCCAPSTTGLRTQRQ